jgi:hypothetical protein
MINKNNVADILPILIKDEETFNRLKNDFPSILADLVTFKDNPNCSCRGRVFKFFSEHLEANPNILDQYVKDASEINVKLQSLSDERAANNYAGKVFLVDKGEEAWAAFAGTLPGKMFRMFSVAERDDKVVVYFL